MQGEVRVPVDHGLGPTPFLPADLTALDENDPTSLGAYELRARLGEGGMGTVFLGRDAAGRWLAVKTLHRHLARRPEFVARFSREVDNARRVDSPYTPAVVAADPSAPVPYLVTEFVDGPTLNRELAIRGLLSPPELHQLAVNLASAILAFHRAGIVHRDITPANIIMSRTGPRIIDLGISRAMDDVIGITASGQQPGNPQLMAPEQWTGGRPTTASDVFAWGGVIAYAGTGRLPFAGSRRRELRAAVLQRPPTLDGLDDTLRPLVALALVKDPAARPTIRDLLAHLLGAAPAEEPVGPLERASALFSGGLPPGGEVPGDLVPDGGVSGGGDTGGGDTARADFASTLPVRPTDGSFAVHRPSPVAMRPVAGSAAELAGIADDLAVAVRRQWEAEAALRRLNDPYAMPVRWRSADQDLVAHWASLVRLATRGPGWPPPEPGTWATEPDGLAGSDNDLVDVLGRVPTGRLLVLGEPGAGKTILTVRLVLDLLAQRRPGGPVPILVPLASWDPREQGLLDWLEARLALDYPGLRERAPRAVGTSRGRALLELGLVLPVLDGLDEIPDAARGQAIASINDAMRPGQRLVVTARTRPFRAAVRPDDGIEVGLTGAAGIELCPLDAEVVAEFLRGSAGGPTVARRWEPVVAALVAPSDDHPVGRVLTTPLTVTLARTIYNPRPGETPTQALPDPAELLDVNRFPSAAAIEDHLFDAFVPAAYRDCSGLGRRGRRAAEQAEQWLVFLATHLDDNLRGTTDLAWWELRYAAPKPLIATVVGSVAGCAVAAAAGLGSRLGVGLGVALGIGVGLGLVIGLGVRAVRRSTRRAAPGLAGGLVGGLAGGVLAGLAGTLGIGLSGGDSASFATSISLGLVVGMAAGPPAGFLGGLAGGTAGGLGSGLLAGLSQGLAAAVVNGAAVGMSIGLTVSLVGRRLPARGVHWSAVGLAAGIPIGLVVGAVAGLTAGLATGLVAGALVVVAFTLGTGLTGTAEDLTAANGPPVVLARDRRTFLIVGSTAAVTSAFVGWLLTALAAALRDSSEAGTGSAPGTGSAVVAGDGFRVGLGDGLLGGLGIGLATSVWCALLISFLHAAWGSFAVARYWLALRGQLPLRLMAFLADAHVQRGVLRQAGAVYQFRHAELQRRLASRPVGRGRHRRPAVRSHRPRPGAVEGA